MPAGGCQVGIAKWVSACRTWLFDVFVLTEEEADRLLTGLLGHRAQLDPHSWPR